MSGQGCTQCREAVGNPAGRLWGGDVGISRIELTPEFVKRHRDDVANRRRLGISAPGEEEAVYTFLPDLNAPRRLEARASLLLARGHSDTRVGKILGGNFARLFREVWRPPVAGTSP